MAGSILVRDALHRVSMQLQDINPQFTRWTQRELVQLLNDGQKAIAKYLPWSCSRVDTVKLVAGTKQSIETIAAASIKPGDGSAAAAVNGASLLGLVRNMGADGLTPGRSIRIVDREVMDVNNPLWHTETATAIQSYLFDPRFPKVYYVSPGVPTGGNVWVELSMLANPVEIVVPVSLTAYVWDGSDVTKLSIDDVFIDDLIHYVLAAAYMKDAEYAADGGLAQAHSALFTGSINSQAAARTGVNPNLRSLPFNPNVPAAR